ncbi:hypothetical protein MP228_006615 [Amoeboaphelidium protococcarum]|nr:hypothetical protein MP228_006615 [Amoeboaphelidium protococcarum]
MIIEINLRSLRTAGLIAVPWLMKYILPHSVKKAMISTFAVIFRYFLMHVIGRRITQLPQWLRSRRTLSISTAPKPPRLSSIVKHEILLSHQADRSGVAYAGTILSHIDICAGIVAKSHSQIACVTASLDSIHFVRPVNVGDIMCVSGTITRAFRSSMEICVELYREDHMSGEREFCCQAYLTFVAIQDGKAVQVCPVSPESEKEIKDFELAEVRKQARLALKKAQSELMKPAQVDFVDSGGNVVQVQGEGVRTEQINDPHAESVKIIMPQHANALGITFGGYILQCMEECAIMAAMRHAHQSRIVDKDLIFHTVSIDSLNFRKSSTVGDFVRIQAKVTRVWKTSLEIYVTVHSKSPTDAFNDDLQFTNDGYMTVLATVKGEKYKEHSRVDIPDVQPHSDQDRQRHNEADTRRCKRLEERSALTKIYKI